MPYADLSKVIPDNVKGPAEFLDKIIDEEDKAENDAKPSDEPAPQKSKALKPTKLPGEQVIENQKVEQAKEDKVKHDKEKKRLLRQLKNWQGSYHYLESTTPPRPIPGRLKEKVSKILSQGFDAKVSSMQTLVDELKFVTGHSYTSPADQADMIIKANHIIELVLVRSGYDVTGFAKEAATTCKDPLVMCLIENDLLGDIKVNPLYILGLTYISALGGAYLKNKASAAEHNQPVTTVVPVADAAAALPLLNASESTPMATGGFDTDF